MTHHSLNATNFTVDRGEVELGFSFAGGGWLMCYMFGVAKALRASGVHHEARFTGTSAGALTAIGLTLDADFDAITHTVVTSYIPQAHSSLLGPFQMRSYLVDALTRHANLHDFDRCNDDPFKCTVVYTSLSAFEPRRKSTFDSPEHLLQTLIASCCATPLVGMPFQFEGEWVIDGGITENQPRFQEAHRVKRTVYVSPNVYDRDAEIKPSQYIPPWWSMYPPSQAEMRWVFELGQADGAAWCQHNGFKCDEAVPAPQRPQVPEPSRSNVSPVRQGYSIASGLVKAIAQPWQQPFAVTLLQLEVAMWKWVAVVIAVADVVMALWTLIVFASLSLGSSESEDTGLEGFAIAVVYVAVWFSRLKHTHQRLSGSKEWTELEEAMQSIQNRARQNKFPALKCLGQCKYLLPTNLHSALTDKSILYSLFVELDKGPSNSSYCRSMSAPLDSTMASMII